MASKRLPKVVPARLGGTMLKVGELREIITAGLPVKFEGKNIVISKLGPRDGRKHSSEIPSSHALALKGELNPFVVRHFHHSRGGLVWLCELQPSGVEKNVGRLQYTFGDEHILPGINGLNISAGGGRLRKRDLGRHLYSIFERLAKKRGYSKVGVSSLKGAVPFWKKLGFYVVGETPRKEFIFMHKDLPK